MFSYIDNSLEISIFGDYRAISVDFPKDLCPGLEVSKHIYRALQVDNGEFFQECFDSGMILWAMWHQETQKVKSGQCQPSFIAMHAYNNNKACTIWFNSLRHNCSLFIHAKQTLTPASFFPRCCSQLLIFPILDDTFNSSRICTIVEPLAKAGGKAKKNHPSHHDTYF